MTADLTSAAVVWTLYLHCCRLWKSCDEYRSSLPHHSKHTLEHMQT